MQEAPAPAVGVSIVTDVARGRQITVQTFYPLGTPKAEIDTLLDELLAPINRQQALAELPELQEELTKAERTLAQFREDLAMVDVNHAAAQAKRGVELEEVQALKATEMAKKEKEAKDETASGNGAILKSMQLAEAEFRASGRRGAFKLQGHQEANIKRLKEAVQQTTDHNTGVLANTAAKYDADIAAKQREIDSAEGDKAQHQQQISVSITRFEKEIERLTGEVEKRRTTAAG